MDKCKKQSDIDITASGNCGKRNGLDMIYRQDAINAVNTALFPKINTAKDAEKALKELPSEEPNLQPNLQPTCNQLATEIIRCKDCKHRFLQDKIWQCPFAIPASENHFCGYAERKEDE